MTETWSSGCIKVSDGDKINICGEQLRVIFAPVSVTLLFLLRITSDSSVLYLLGSIPILFLYTFLS